MMPPSAARVAHAASVVATLCVIGVQVTTGFPGRGRRGASGIWCPQPMLAWDPALQLIATEGRGVWGDSGVPDNAPPPWLDKKRYAAGKAFVAAHPLAISYAHVHALYLLLTVPSVLDVLVYTRNSETPDKAFVRYLDTVNGVGAWYTTDMYKPGTVGHEQLKRVRWLHNLVRRDMNDQQAAHARNRTQLAGDFSDCRVSAGLRRDLAAVARSACPFALGKRDVDNNDLLSDGAVSPWMSQYDMSITQWAFVGPVIQFPEAYGIGNATAEELDGFVHLWEVIGYSLGIEDRFNFCQGGLRPTLRRSREALSGLVLPRLREASPRWEYMARCMADGLGYVLPGVGFKIQLANMMRLTLDAPSPSVEAMLTPLQRQSVQGYRGVMDSMRNDRNNVFGAPIAAAFKQIYPPAAKPSTGGREEGPAPLTLPPKRLLPRPRSVIPSYGYRSESERRDPGLGNASRI